MTALQALGETWATSPTSALLIIMMLSQASLL